jgi:insertion element IS1 protein InsB
MECQHCKKACIKKGRQKKTGKQKYQCKSCKKHQQDSYKRHSYNSLTDAMLVKLLCNSVGSRSISSILGISLRTVTRRIKEIGQTIKSPYLYVKGKTYEVDEMRTYIGKRENKYWVCCSYRKDTKRIVGLSVGKRTRKTLEKVIQPLIDSRAKKIYTDRLPMYRHMITQEQHSTRKRGTNHIERSFLNSRTHLKRLSRKTICYSKSPIVLEACLKIYLWGNKNYQVDNIYEYWKIKQN